MAALEQDGRMLVCLCLLLVILQGLGQPGVAEVQKFRQSGGQGFRKFGLQPPIGCIDRVEQVAFFSCSSRDCVPARQQFAGGRHDATPLCHSFQSRLLP